MPDALILVVDDQPSNLQAAVSLLSLAGYEVVPALSGEQALARARLRTPDLALLDLQMPGMNGLDLCRELRADPRFQALPVVFLTASDQHDMLVEAFRVGAVDYVTKPFVPEELLVRVRTHLDLKRARDRLEQLAEERADLTQIVAHDLKNPLAGILAACAVLERPGAQPQQVARDIRSRVDHCLAFIDTYLGRWAISETPRPLQLAPLDLGQLLAAAVADLAPMAAKQGRRLHTQIDDCPWVHGHAVALRHVIENLVSNALRYADSDIDIQCGMGRSGMAKVVVADRGPGVPEHHRAALFRRYHRLSVSDSPQHSSGLGLAISSEEIVRMGGHLWYEDREGGGAQFQFVLPLMVEAATAPVI